MFTLHLLLTLAWVALTGETSAANFLAGFGVTYFILFLVQRTFEPAEPADRYVRRGIVLARFARHFLWSILIANLRMAQAVLFPTGRLKPAIVAIPLDIDRPSAITLLANWITLTPGTLSLDISPDRRTLLVHTFDRGDSLEAFRRQIKNDFERRIIELYE